MKTREIEKLIEKLGDEYYTSDRFVFDAKEWIKCIGNGTTMCIVVSVSRSGMSRRLKYVSFVGGHYRVWSRFFSALGYKPDGNNAITVSGCGMDLNFNHCYNVAHKLHSLGLLSKLRLSGVSQSTPTIM